LKQRTLWSALSLNSEESRFWTYLKIIDYAGVAKINMEANKMILEKGKDGSTEEITSKVRRTRTHTCTHTRTHTRTDNLTRTRSHTRTHISQLQRLAAER
jgi:carbohydrate-binding DOMON domain-containing protein